MTEALWTPSTEAKHRARLTQFQKEVGQSGPYDALHDWSVRNPEDFWSSVWDFAGIIGEKEAPAIAPAASIKDTLFFPNARLNYAENLLSGPANDRAVVFLGENGVRETLSTALLRREVAKMQVVLQELGVEVGDRVAGVVPNTPKALIAMLAVTSLGAVWSSCSPDFGTSGILDRFGQIEPKILFAVDHYFYNGREFSCSTAIRDASQKLQSLKKVIVFSYAGESVAEDDFGALAASWSELAAPIKEEDPHFERVNFNDPLFILFSSGTTGLPKCIVHGVGGTLIQHLKEHILTGDLGRDDCLFYYTTCGWMMWNWTVSALQTGATLVLYDGSPFFPDGDRMAEICEEMQATHFGTSAKFIDACAKAEIRPNLRMKLDALRVIYSTGSPLAPEGFQYIYQNWKADLRLSSVAGGTDIIGCFVGGSPISPVYAGQCQKPQLGLDVKVFDEGGRSIEGPQGELVCCNAHPSMPIYFWNDPDGTKYHKAYFSKFENTWHHGDYVALTPEGGMIFYGRSDAVLNPGGVRIGTSEIYRQIEKVDAVLEGLVVGQSWKNDIRVVLFLRLREGCALDDALKAEIRATIRANSTPRHVPEVILAVEDIPRTKSGKITELAVRDIIHGREVKNTESLANPEALTYFKDLPELMS